MHRNLVAIGSLFFAFVITVISDCDAGNPDEVFNLPGLKSQPKFRQYSGYLNATNGRFLHYWFVESENNPAKDPLLLWLNGGPGCSSLDGLLTENGPFRVGAKGKNLTYNDYSWNKLMNVLYMEAPAGVGFSYSLDKNYKTNDDNVSLDNYVALQHFFQKYPQFAKSNFYITGESYGGIYVPTLTERVLKGNATINIKGFAVGNGMSSYPLNADSLVFFVYHHGLIGIELWTRLTTYCCTGSVKQSTCNFYNNTNTNCGQAVAEAVTVVMGSGLNPYNLYDVCEVSSAKTFSRIHADISNIFQYYKLRSPWLFYTLSKQKFQLRGKLDPPCINSDDVDTYLNRADVRQALHIPAGVQEWSICSADVSSQYQTLYFSMEKQYKFILKNIRGLVYNGDCDMMCNFLGDEWFVDSLGLQITANYTHWRVGNQVGGFVKRFTNLDFVTIRGAGHMVPTNKPLEAFKMITSFIFKKPY